MENSREFRKVSSKRKSSLKENEISNKSSDSSKQEDDFNIKENLLNKNALGKINLFNEWLEFIKSKKIKESFLKGINFRIVRIFLEEIMKCGGYIEAIARQYFEENYSKYFFSSSKEFSNFYERYILPFEKFKNPDIPKNFNPKLLVSCKVIPFPEFLIYLNDEIKFRKCFREDIVIIRGFCQGIGINGSVFSPSSISKHHGEEIVDIRTQDPNFTGIHLGKMNMKADRMKISEYVEYLENVEMKGQDEGFIRFAVNVDCGNWNEITNEFLKVPPQLLFSSQFDALKYCRNKILGVTEPQLYLKVVGCWTGGHQENLNLRAINLNHGPSDCIWYSIDITQVPKLRNCFIEKYDYDIYNNEGLWFLTIEECHSFGIPLTKVIQKPGDVVVLAPGAMHWVKSLGTTVNSAWNFATKNLNQFESMYNRYTENRKIKFRNLIPIKTLFFDLFIHEFIDDENTGKFKMFIIEKLLDFISEEGEKLNRIRHKFEFRKQADDENVGFFKLESYL